MNDAGLTPYLEQLKFNLVGYGCTTCIGNSGPLPEPVADAVQKEKLTVAAVLSGNRNFEGRINSLVRANYLASPPLVVAYALAGRVDIDLEQRTASAPIGNGKDVFLKDIWPTTEEVQAAVGKHPFAPRCSTKNIRKSSRATSAGTRSRFPPAICIEWSDQSTYIRKPAVFRQHGGPDDVRCKTSRGAARARDAGRFRHHRSHFARRQHPRRQPGRKIPDRAWRETGRFQLLRLRAAAITK